MEEKKDKSIDRERLLQEQAELKRTLEEATAALKAMEREELAEKKRREMPPSAGFANPTMPVQPPSSAPRADLEFSSRREPGLPKFDLAPEPEAVQEEIKDPLENIMVGTKISYQGKNYTVTEITGEENNITYKIQGEKSAAKIPENKLREALESGNAVVVKPEAKSLNSVFPQQDTYFEESEQPEEWTDADEQRVKELEARLAEIEWKERLDSAISAQTAQPSAPETPPASNFDFYQSATQIEPVVPLSAEDKEFERVFDEKMEKLIELIEGAQAQHEAGNYFTMTLLEGIEKSFEELGELKGKGKLSKESLDLLERIKETIADLEAMTIEPVPDEPEFEYEQGLDRTRRITPSEEPTPVPQKPRAEIIAYKIEIFSADFIRGVILRLLEPHVSEIKNLEVVGKEGEIKISAAVKEFGGNIKLETVLVSKDGKIVLKDSPKIDAIWPYKGKAEKMIAPYLKEISGLIKVWAGNDISSRKKIEVKIDTMEIVNGGLRVTFK